MNRLTLQDLVKGKYGRKIAYANVEEINENNILKVLAKTIGTFNNNRTVVQYLWDYKNGDQPVRYREKTVRDDITNVVVENHAWEIVQFKNAQTYGEPVQYVSRRKDENVSKYIDILNDYMEGANKQVRDISSGEWTSAVGTGFKAVQRKNGDIPFRITVPTPLNTYVVYSELTEEPLLAVQILKDAEGKQYFLCFDNKYEYRVQGGKLLTYNVDGMEVVKRFHMFDDIPIIEYPNNQDRISDIELVIDMLDCINNLQSNRIDGVEQFIQSFIKFINCEIDADTFNEMRKQGAFMVKSTKDKQADVEIMSQELNQTQTQVFKEDIWENILTISAIPNKEGGNKSGDSQGAVELRAGWDFAKSRARLKDPFIEQAEKQLAKVVLGVIRIAKGEQECPINTLDMDVKISHSPTDNLCAKVNALSLMLQAGIEPKNAIQTSGIWSDSEKVYLQSKETLDIKQEYTKKDEIDGNIENRPIEPIE